MHVAQPEACQYRGDGVQRLHLASSCSDGPDAKVKDSAKEGEAATDIGTVAAGATPGIDLTEMEANSALRGRFDEDDAKDRKKTLGKHRDVDEMNFGAIWQDEKEIDHQVCKRQDRENKPSKPSPRKVTDGARPAAKAGESASASSPSVPRGSSPTPAVIGHAGSPGVSDKEKKMLNRSSLRLAE
ncbi:hypothetical protein BGZ95_010501 [Linnemannia exigua]|uniref:Uncharacterized protein n=1 Tax=Linnemannia exigua TaxID=604196 RepID=A0AAD4H5U9_9FUNG|nr:hypothetical protein BGZ95_010501 [Linnemannia exigua]